MTPIILRKKHPLLFHFALRIIALPFAAYILYYNSLFWLHLPTPSFPEPAILLAAIAPAWVSIYLAEKAPTGFNLGLGMIVAVFTIMGLATGLSTALAMVSVWLYACFAIQTQDEIP